MTICSLPRPAPTEACCLGAIHSTLFYSQKHSIWTKKILTTWTPPSSYHLPSPLQLPTPDSLTTSNSTKRSRLCLPTGTSLSSLAYKPHIFQVLRLISRVGSIFWPLTSAVPPRDGLRTLRFPYGCKYPVLRLLCFCTKCPFYLGQHSTWRCGHTSVCQMDESLIHLPHSTKSTP